MKVKQLLRFTAHVALGAVLIATVPWLIGTALAATGVAPPVPPPGPDAIAAYLSAYGWIVGLLTLAYVLAGWALRKYASSHWLAQGKRLAWATALVGIAGTALQAYVSGTPVSGVLATAVLGLLHIADAQQPALAARSGQSGRVTVAALTWLAMGALLMLAIASCGASQRETTIRAALVSVDSARDGFLAYDRSHEMSLVAHCDPAVDTREQCQTKVNASSKALADYQAKRAKVDPMFGAAYRAIAAAEILADDPSLTGMQNAIVQLFAAVKPFIAPAAPVAPTTPTLTTGSK